MKYLRLNGASICSGTIRNMCLWSIMPWTLHFYVKMGKTETTFRHINKRQQLLVVGSKNLSSLITFVNIKVRDLNGWLFCDV
jgi:hypothetical protein